MLDWVRAQVGGRARIAGWMRLRGGAACRVDAIDVVDAAGVRHPLVLKRFVRADWVARDPDLARREARHLRLLEPVDLPIPRLVGVDAEGVVCGLPVLLTSRLPGRVVLAPDDLDGWLRGLVESLVQLHEIDGGIAERLGPWRSYTHLETLAPPPWSRRPEVWERAIARLGDAAPGFAPRFLHRDYQPANLLWTGGRVTGVLDFNDSCRGAAALDLGHCRLNLVQLHGPAVAERFLEIHRSLAPGVVELDPYWDLLSLVQILPGPERVYPGWSGSFAGRLDVRLLQDRLEDWAAGLVARIG